VALRDIIQLGADYYSYAITVLCGSTSITRALCFCKLPVPQVCAARNARTAHMHAGG
jgi:hypothetical protein